MGRIPICGMDAALSSDKHHPAVASYSDLPVAVVAFLATAISVGASGVDATNTGSTRLWQIRSKWTFCTRGFTRRSPKRSRTRNLSDHVARNEPERRSGRGSVQIGAERKRRSRADVTNH